MKPVAALESVWPTGASFKAHYETREEGPGYFVYTAAPGQELPPEAVLGALVSVKLRFVAEEREFAIHARVIERREAASPRGLRLEFLPDERDREELILACARGESVPYFKRRHERITCSFKAEVTLANGSTAEGTVHDLSEGGLRLEVERALHVDDLLRLSFPLPPEAEPLVVHGRVMSLTPTGPEPGAGVAFQFRSAEERDRVAGRVARLRG